MEKLESEVLLELKALREGTHKLAEWTVYARDLAFRVSPALRALLKVVAKAHPTIHAMLIDLAMYSPRWLVMEPTVVPPSLSFHPGKGDPAPTEEAEVDVASLLGDMTTAGEALRRLLGRL